MARLPRYCLPDYPQHVIQRGNNRSPIFIADEDYSCYVHCLLDAIQRDVAEIHAYVFMTNHVHLLMTPRRSDSLARILQSVGRRYVRYFNDAYQRTGTLWEGRYKATVIDSELYLLRCYRYIELNPVRAGMVTHPGDYQWSSYRAHAHGGADRLIVDHAGYLALGSTAEARQTAYRALFADSMDDFHLEAIRQAKNIAWVLGNDQFQEQVAALLHRRVRPIPLGRPKKVSEKGL
jgi:REP-associated tyrosine transposase